ncbi:Hypothetical protein PENO1_036860 [Penicillium occitanis (nom. inval.)]|nr:Hypothetical protein PENO1_036860 [Penicillium occitanis (nom. inval.)]PCH09793.1 hypothetical protein PENOC_008050 [Penicillium occitanis (nom. inval.)]
MSTSRRATNGMSYHTSPSGHQQMNSNDHYIQSPENASYHDGATPLAISPNAEADVMNMQSQAPFAEEPRADHILNGYRQTGILAHTATLNTGHPSPWHAYRNQMGSDQDVFLSVPDNTRSRGTGTRGSLSTVDTPYTASSNGRSDVTQERIEPRRGGRQPGSRLPEASVQNVRQRINKWTQMGPLSTLFQRNGRTTQTWWISEHAFFPPGQERFELPLYFGFGKVFEGFYAVEYAPTTVEAQRSHAVGRGDQPQIDQGILVCPVYDSAEEAQRMIWDWLKEALTNAQSMRKWLKRCFPGKEIKWIRKLLRSTWEYSIKCWQESRNFQIEEAELDHNLLEAWMAALLVTMLSLPITIPEQVVHNIIPRLRFSSYNHPFPKSSRALARAVKALLFDMYRQFVDRLTSALRDFEKLKLEGASDRRLGHIYCVAILVMVITSHIQTSLMDNGRLSSRQQSVDPNLLWEETYEHIQGVECAFKNTIMFIKHNNARWLRKNTISDAKLLVLRQDIQEIERTCLDATEGHRNVDLERLIKSNDFHGPNMQRVFDFYFEHLVRKDTSTRAE